MAWVCPEQEGAHGVYVCARLQNLAARVQAWPRFGSERVVRGSSAASLALRCSRGALGASAGGQRWFGGLASFYEAASGFCEANGGTRRWQTAGPSRRGVTHRLPGLAPRLPLPKLTPLRGGALPRGLAQGRAEDKHGLSAQPLDPDAQARTLALPRASCVTSSTFLNLSLVSVRPL